MQQEIEIKLDIPELIEANSILQRLEKIALENNFESSQPKKTTRMFQYYDTSKLDVYKKGHTIRRVSGFDPSKAKGAFRYDFKIGSLDNRYEANHWTDNELSEDDIIQRFNLAVFYTSICPSASARTQHHTIKLKRKETLIEATLDYFDVLDGAEFSELELELEHGDASYLAIFSAPIQKDLGLQILNRQKYSRIIESMPKYGHLTRFS